MPSFLSKVFSRKKSDDKGSSSSTKRASIHSLLEGKYENISPMIDTFANAGKTQSEKSEPIRRELETDKENRNERSSLALFRSSSRPKSPSLPATKRSPSDIVPHLTLSLPGLKGESRKDPVLGVVFEANTEGQVLLDESTIAEKRLNAIQALILIRSCSNALSARGLDTLGLMHPHWHSESPTVQRKLLSLFILSLDPKPLITTLMPTPTSTVTAFETELNYTRSLHDITAILRWGLRHLELQNGAFGKDDKIPYAWYDNFAEAESENSFSRKAFSQYLRPNLPPPHFELLMATLNIMSALGARSEMNGTSGNKLSMFLGYYLLTGNKMSGLNHWKAYYDGWYQAGKILEHLFLANIRDQSVDEKIPQRLLELISNYPYKDSTDTGPAKFMRPRFATRSHDALYVKVEIEMDPDDSKPSQPDSLRLVQDALKLNSQAQSPELLQLWEGIKTSAVKENSTDDGPLLPGVFTDETIRLLSLKSDEDKDGEEMPAITMFTPAPHPHLRRSASWMNTVQGDTNTRISPNALGKSFSTGSPDTSSPISPIASDWNLFSATGFGNDNSEALASSLLDTDLEKTTSVSVPASRKSSKKSKATPSRGRRSSIDFSQPPTMKSPIQPKEVRCIVGPIVELDEAFVDFWSDSLLDPIVTARPTFAICQLKRSVDLPSDGRKINWLVVEQSIQVREPPPPPPEIRSSSPRPSRRSEVGRPASRVSFSTTKKRFALFGGSHENISSDGKGSAKKAGKGSKVGELGELLPSESSTDVASIRSKGGYSYQSTKDDRESTRNAHTLVAGASAMTAVLEQDAETNHTNPVESATKTVKAEDATIAAPVLVTPSTPPQEVPSRPDFDSTDSNASLPESAIFNRAGELTTPTDGISSTTAGRESRFIEHISTPLISKLPELAAEEEPAERTPPSVVNPVQNVDMIHNEEINVSETANKEPKLMDIPSSTDQRTEDSGKLTADSQFSSPIINIAQSAPVSPNGVHFTVQEKEDSSKTGEDPIRTDTLFKNNESVVVADAEGDTTPRNEKEAIEDVLGSSALTDASNQAPRATSSVIEQRSYEVPGEILVSANEVTGLTLSSKTDQIINDVTPVEVPVPVSTKELPPLIENDGAQNSDQLAAEPNGSTDTADLAAITGNKESENES